MFFENSDGNVSVMTAALLFVTTALAGGAVDYTNAARVKADLQRKLDAAVIHALRPGDRTEPERRALLDDALSGFDECPATFEGEVSDSRIEGTASCKVDSFIASIAGIDFFDVSVSSAAQIVDGSLADENSSCIHITQTSGQSLILNEQGAIRADCGIEVASGSNEAMVLNSSTVLDAPRICVAGNILNNGAIFSTPPETGCAAEAESVSALDLAPAGCTSFGVAPSGDHTLQPGTYCGEVVANPGITLTLEPGLYRFEQGSLVIGSGASLFASDVTLDFVGDFTALRINQASVVELDAPDTGEHAGILLRAPATNIGNFVIDSELVGRLGGRIEIPGSELILNSVGGINEAAEVLSLVSRRLTVNAPLNLRSGGASGADGAGGAASGSGGIASASAYRRVRVIR
jgi:hypothetical protein